MIDLAHEVADPARYGWKAHYLSRLLDEGFSVPGALAIAPDETPDAARLDPDVAYAVRSSGLAEDGRSGSYAGHFTTHLDVRGADDVLAAIDDVRASGAGEMPMGVVVQQMVATPTASGVAFSVHPVTLARDVAVVSWVRGLGDGLVSGALDGNDLVVNPVDGTVASGEWPLGEGLLHDITDVLARLQDLLGQPVDVEWCVAEDTGALVLLQVRPVVLPAPGVIGLDTVEAFAGLPGGIAAHSKLALRAEAVLLGVPMSRARVIVATQPGGVPEVLPFPVGERSAGRSVVLLHPARIAGRIVREFAKDTEVDVDSVVRGSARHTIRQEPDRTDAAHSIAHLLGVGLERSALAGVIEQEILRAYATGILRRASEGYLVEVALGHFVPKGYVETSAFALAKDLTVTLRSEAPQTKAFHFMNGHVVEESPPDEQLSLSDADLQRLVRAMEPILELRPVAALEFGLLGDRGGALAPYLIDVADADRPRPCPSPISPAVSCPQVRRPDASST